MKRIAQYFCLFTIVFTTAITAQTVSTLLRDTNFGFPESLNINENNILFAPSGRLNLIYRIELSGQFSVLARNLAFPQGGTVDGTGRYISSFYNTGVLRRFEEDGSGVNIASGFSGPTGARIDASGDTIYVANYPTNSISKVALTGGTVSTFVSGGGINGPDGLAFDENGNLYIANFNDNKVHVADRNGNLSLFATLPSPNSGYMVYGNNEFYITGNRSHQVFRISMTGDVSLLAGSGMAGFRDGPADSAQFNITNGIAINAGGDLIYVVDVFNRAIRIINLETTSIGYQDGFSPDFNFRLEQNYPNPFNPETKIGFDLGKSEKLTLTVYDVTGKRVSVLLDRTMPAGSHEVAFNGDFLSSGVYFYQMHIGDQVMTRKMVLLR